MPKYRNTRTGRVVDVPETAPNRPDRPNRDKQWSEHLRRLTRSRRWQRVTDSIRAGMPTQRPKRTKAAAAPPDPSAAEVRKWAADNGVGVPEKGKLPPEVVKQYLAAQES